jgi:hypothetical protein
MKQQAQPAALEAGVAGDKKDAPVAPELGGHSPASRRSSATAGASFPQSQRGCPVQRAKDELAAVKRLSKATAGATFEAA